MTAPRTSPADLLATGRTARWSAPVFPLKAADFIKRGVAKGPALDAALAAAEQAWIAAGFPGDAAALESIATAATHPSAETPPK